LASRRAAPALAAPALALAIAVALAGCGGGDDAPRDPEAEAIRTVLRTQLAAVAEGDGEAACSHLTPRGRRQVEARLRSEVRARDCAGAVAEAARDLPAPALDALNAPVISNVHAAGARAEASVEPPGDLKELALAAGFTDVVVEVRLVRSRGRWLVDHLALP
jgi:hypothetical protein